MVSLLDDPPSRTRPGARLKKYHAHLVGFQPKVWRGIAGVRYSPVPYEIVSLSDSDAVHQSAPVFDCQLNARRRHSIGTLPRFPRRKLPSPIIPPVHCSQSCPLMRHAGERSRTLQKGAEGTGMGQGRRSNPVGPTPSVQPCQLTRSGQIRSAQLQCRRPSFFSLPNFE